MKTQLSHKDLVKLGLHESSQGRSLSQIEADFHKQGIQRRDSIKALKTVDYIRKGEERKARKEEASKQQQAEDKTAGTTQTEQSQTQKKPSFWPWLILLLLIGIGLYLYFSGTLSFDFLSAINLK